MARPILRNPVGTHVEVGPLQRLREGLHPILERVEDDALPWLLLETPGSRDPGSDQIALIKELRS